MRNNRIDATQPAIVKALRQIGAFVQPLNAVKGGCPDLLVGYRGRWFVMEVKDGGKPPSGRKLTEDELEWWQSVRGIAPVSLAENVDDAIKIITKLR